MRTVPSAWAGSPGRRPVLRLAVRLASRWPTGCRIIIIPTYSQLASLAGAASSHRSPEPQACAGGAPGRGGAALEARGALAQCHRFVLSRSSVPRPGLRAPRPRRPRTLFPQRGGRFCKWVTRRSAGLCTFLIMVVLHKEDFAWEGRCCLQSCCFRGPPAASAPQSGPLPRPPRPAPTALGKGERGGGSWACPPGGSHKPARRFLPAKQGRPPPKELSVTSRGCLGRGPRRGKAGRGAQPRGVSLGGFLIQPSATPIRSVPSWGHVKGVHSPFLKGPKSQ